ncbi:transcriptional regulator, AraC family [Paenibacillus curdlanolyticus YK9]|uniref:Transcriptional regulator, AraC family n=1 Tax=Paenibacillus curdlanolyticus YK9 TaxID=717606 RepID=E0IBJ7_9BACL|nr:AraC family transcriptional regulator [Paenibacillus curdlanolyticus]EFM10077.1 transcriptional regulator, AraC family [Paenibacillus curdlanolyticus YK9]
MNDIHVHLTAYSQHKEPFHHLFANGIDTYLIRLQSEGISQALVDGALTDVRPGDLLLYKPGDMYDLRIGSPHEPTPIKPNGDYYVMSTGPGMKEWWNSKERQTRTKIAEDSRIKSIWHHLIAEKNRLDGGSPALVTSLVWSLLQLLDRAIEEAPVVQSAAAYHALRMRHYIEEHAAHELHLKDVAQHSGLSVSRAVHLFKAHFGMSIIGYTQKLRLTRAVKLMDHSPLSLEQIAAETGLGSYAYFHRIFRAQYGISPGAYRKQSRE